MEERVNDKKRKIDEQYQITRIKLNTYYLHERWQALTGFLFSLLDEKIFGSGGAIFLLFLRKLLFFCIFIALIIRNEDISFGLNEVWKKKTSYAKRFRTVWFVAVSYSVVIFFSIPQ